MNKISIIGTGSVGSTIAYTLAVMGIASQIVMIDINNEKALGEALDIRQGTPFLGACSVYAGDYRDAAGSNIVILTSGIARKPGQSRLDLAQTNVNITKSIIPEIVKYAPDATYIIVSNPVDILTYTFCKRSGLPENRIIGSGTILDTARLRARIADYCGLEVGNIHAYMFGEHGDSGFAPWSIASIAGMPIEEYRASLESKDIFTTKIDIPEIEKYVRESGSRVIARKGATFYAIASTVSYIVKAIYTNANIALTVSSMMHGEYGVDDVCLSTINIVGHDGIIGKINPKLTDEEVAKLQNSANVLKEIIAQIDFNN